VLNLWKTKKAGGSFKTRLCWLEVSFLELGKGLVKQNLVGKVFFIYPVSQVSQSSAYRESVV
jgi:hypothetical protein